MLPIHKRFPSWATLSEIMEAFSTVSAADDMCSLKKRQFVVSKRGNACEITAKKKKRKMNTNCINVFTKMYLQNIQKNTKYTKSYNNIFINCE